MHFIRVYRVIIAGMALLIAGCAVGPNFRAPVAPTVANYTASPVPNKTTSSPVANGESQHFKFNRDIPAEWWQLFHSKSLNALIERGLNNSPTLQATQAALLAAQENLRAEIGAGLFPNISAQLEDQRQRFSSQSIGQPPSASIFTLYNASVNVTYTLDVFGGIRRQIETFRAQVDYQRFQLEAAYLTLTANIVTTAITEASLRAQIKATHELINLQENQLKIVKQQFVIGSASRSDVLVQETEVDQTKATLPPLENNLAQTQHALAVLVGSFPGDQSMPTFNLDELRLPPNLPVTLPSTLVRQRPDVRAAEALLHQASAEIGVATANLLPQFPLTAGYGYVNTQLGDLFKGSSSVWNYGGQLLQPIFNGGALIAQRRAALATYDQIAAQYRQTVLSAFQNVGDALKAVQYDANALKAEVASERASKESLSLAEMQFRLGGIDYLSLLIAERQYQQAKINRIRAQAARYADTAALFQALGGGWWNRSPQQTTKLLDPTAAHQAAVKLQATT